MPEGARYVVPVSDIYQFAAGKAWPPFAKRKEIRNDLARMLTITQSVDDGHGCEQREIFKILVTEHARNDAVDPE